MSITASDFIQMQARLAKGKRKPAPADACPDGEESVLQQQIVNDLKQRRWIGVRSRMDKRSTNKVGTCDFIIMASAGRTFFIECKTKSTKLSPEQLAFKMWGELLGHKVHEIRSFGQYLTAIEA